LIDIACGPGLFVVRRIQRHDEPLLAVSGPSRVPVGIYRVDGTPLVELPELRFP
jgi:hypothetical protein